MPVPTAFADAYFSGAQTDRVTRLVTIFRDPMPFWNCSMEQVTFRRLYTAVTGGVL